MPGFVFEEIDEDDAYDRERQRKVDEESALIRCAMEDLLAGRFDTEAVKEAKRLGALGPQ